MKRLLCYFSFALAVFAKESIFAAGVGCSEVIIEIDKLKNSLTDLMIASRDGHVDAVSKLVTSDINLNQQDDQGRTALYIAAQEDKNEVIKILLAQRDIDINLSDNQGMTPLAIATENECSEAVATLLHYLPIGQKNISLDMNKPDNVIGLTPLVRAIKKNNDIIVKLLLSSKANPSIDTQHSKINLKKLVEDSTLNQSTKDDIAKSQFDCILNTKHFIEACEAGSFDEAIKLLDNPIDINELKDPNNLYKVARNLFLFKYLYNLQKPDCNKALISLILKKDRISSDVLKFLLANGANINQIIKGRTLLHETIISNNLEIVKLLIDKNADTSIRTTDGYLPYALALESRANSAITEILAKDITCKNKCGIKLKYYSSDPDCFPLCTLFTLVGGTILGVTFGFLAGYDYI